ncbi:hypothetical protein D3C81_1797280 [compost metagenome]
MRRHTKEAAKLRLCHALGLNELGVLGVQADGLPVQAHFQNHGFVGIGRPHVLALELFLEPGERFISKGLLSAQHTAGDRAIGEQLACVSVHGLPKPQCLPGVGDRVQSI